jgi:hypothetical protein
MAERSKRIGRPTKAGKEGEKSALGVRASAELKQRLIHAAERNGRSLSQEAEMRLERSFSEERGWGGPAIQHMAYLMASTFALAGSRAAHAKQHGDWTPEEWIHEPYCYEAAVAAVMDRLLSERPEGLDGRAVVNRLLTRLANAGIAVGADQEGQDDGR